MIKFRTISHLLEIFLLPEIEKRIKKGTIKESDLPLELYQFRSIGFGAKALNKLIEDI